MARVFALLRSPLHTNLFPKTIRPTLTTWRSKAIALIPTLLLSGLLTLTLPGCANRTPAIRVVDLPDLPNAKETRRLSGDIREVAPPAVFIDLEALMEKDQPRVEITYPKADQIVDDTQINVKLKLRGLSIYKDEDVALGPHLQIILDNQPARTLYSLEEDITFKAIAPGSHTLRVLAVRPWGESFKNAEAYAQTTFHVFAKTGANTPDPNKPLLTYNQPQDTYGAEPVLLDFYLTNAPLHQIAQESNKDDITDWKIQCSVNGQQFVFDRWEPIYLKGLKRGQNWIQLTLIDEQGQPIDNTFNNTVRTLTYDPDQRESLDKIVRGELPLSQIGQIADPGYTPPAEPIAPSAPEEPAEIVEPEPTEPEPTEPELVEPELVEPGSLESETADSQPVQDVLPQPDKDIEEIAPSDIEQPEPEKLNLTDTDTAIIENEEQDDKESEEKATDSITNPAEASGNSLWQQLRQRVQSTWKNSQPAPENLNVPIEASDSTEASESRNQITELVPPEKIEEDLLEEDLLEENLPKEDLLEENLLEEDLLEEDLLEEDLLEENLLEEDLFDEDLPKEDLLEETKIPDPVAIPDSLKTPEIPTENLLLPRTEPQIE